MELVPLMNDDDVFIYKLAICVAHNVVIRYYPSATDPAVSVIVFEIQYYYKQLLTFIIGAHAAIEPRRVSNVILCPARNGCH